MLYRATINLSIGVQAGEPFRATRLSEKARQILEAKGRIVPVHAPPIAAVEGWEQRAAQIAEALGVTMLDEFIEANATGYETWTREAIAVLTPRNCKHCGGK